MTYEKPYPYQQEFIARFFRALNAGTRRMLGVMPTGTGKTVVFAEIAKRLNKKTLILAHRDELIQQAAETLKLVWKDADYGIVKAERNETNHQVTIASVQSLHKRRLKTLPAPQLIITDEAHHAVSPSYKRIYHRFGLLDTSPDKKDPLTPINSNSIHLGVTATPKRGDRKGLKPIFDKIIYDGKLFDFVPDYLSDLKVRGIHADLDFSQVPVSRLTRDFDDQQLAEIMIDDKVNNHILKAYQDNARDRARTLAFCVTREHARNLYGSFTANGIPSAYVDYQTPTAERKRAIDDLQSGKIKALFNVAIFTEGFDIPSIDCIIVARPTKSSLLLTQMIGRGTRKAEGKPDCLVLDVAMYQRGIDAVSVASLFDLKPTQLTADPERTIGSWITAADPKPVSEPTHTPPPAYSIESILDTVFAIRDEFHPTKFWHSHPATEKQLRVINAQLTAVGEPPIGNVTKGQAFEMIAEIFSQSPATPNQLRYLRGLGVDYHHDITKPEASRFIDEARARKQKR